MPLWLKTTTTTTTKTFINARKHQFQTLLLKFAEIIKPSNFNFQKPFYRANSTSFQSFRCLVSLSFKSEVNALWVFFSSGWNFYKITGSFATCKGTRIPEYSSRNPEFQLQLDSTEKISGIQYLESGIHGVESRFQVCLGFTYMSEFFSFEGSSLDHVRWFYSGIWCNVR